MKHLLFAILTLSFTCASANDEVASLCEKENLKYIMGQQVCTNWSESSAPIKNTCEEAYVPPHSPKDIENLKRWATGRVFLLFADKADLDFDSEAYGQANPYNALFNFGLATSTNCLSSDILVYYISMLNHVRSVYAKYDDGDYLSMLKFQAILLKLAKAYNMEIYLSPRGQLVQSNATQKLNATL